MLLFFVFMIIAASITDNVVDFAVLLAVFVGLSRLLA